VPPPCLVLGPFFISFLRCTVFPRRGLVCSIFRSSLIDKLFDDCRDERVCCGWSRFGVAAFDSFFFECAVLVSLLFLLPRLWFVFLESFEARDFVNLDSMWGLGGDGCVE